MCLVSKLRFITKTREKWHGTWRSKLDVCLKQALWVVGWFAAIKQRRKRKEALRCVHKKHVCTNYGLFTVGATTTTLVRVANATQAVSVLPQLFPQALSCALIGSWTPRHIQLFSLLDILEVSEMHCLSELNGNSNSSNIALERWFGNADLGAPIWELRFWNADFGTPILERRIGSAEPMLISPWSGA